MALEHYPAADSSHLRYQNMQLVVRVYSTIQSLFVGGKQLWRKPRVYSFITIIARREWLSSWLCLFHLSLSRSIDEDPLVTKDNIFKKSSRHTETSGYCTLALKLRMSMQNDKRTDYDPVSGGGHWKTKLHRLGDVRLRGWGVMTPSDGTESSAVDDRRSASVGILVSAGKNITSVSNIQRFC